MERGTIWTFPKRDTGEGSESVVIAKKFVR